MEKTKTKEFYLEGIMSCTCHESYKSRKMTDPQCVFCNYGEDVLVIMEQYAAQFKDERQKEDVADVIIFLEEADREDYFSASLVITKAIKKLKKLLNSEQEPEVSDTTKMPNERDAGKQIT